MFIFIPVSGTKSQPVGCKAEVRAWKEYVCVACGGTFRSLVNAMRVGRGRTTEEAEARARALVARAIEERVEARPCPNCGCYQPDAEAAIRHRKFEPFCYLPLVGVPVAVLAMPAQDNPWFWMLGLALIVIGSVQVVILATRNVNRDPRRARARFEKDVRAGVLKMVTAGVDPDTLTGAMPYTDLGRPRRPFVLMFAGAALFVAADVGLWVSGAPMNVECRPVVAGPGDDVTVFAPKSIAALEGNWTASATARITNAEELGLPNGVLSVATQTGGWPSSFTENVPKNRIVYPWARFTVPDSSTLEGRTLQLETTLEIKYPQLTENLRSFNEITRTITYSSSVDLSVSGAGARQAVFWWISTIGGAAAIAYGLNLMVDAFRGAKGRVARPLIVAVDSLD